MVGVPGRSNACHTCRERKIRCDGGKPYCARCTRGRHICRGYERPRVFVNQFLTDDTPTGSCIPLRNGRWRIYVKPRSRPSLPDRVESILTCPSPKAHEREQLLARFVHSFCPKGTPSLGRSAQLHHYWVQVLPSLCGSSSMADAAIWSLITAYLGQIEGDVSLQKQTTSLYGNALHELSKITSAPGFHVDDNTLASIMCLGMSEIYFPPIGHIHGWISHNRGGCELLGTRGLNVLNSDLGKDLFLRFRVTGVWSELTFEASPTLECARSYAPTGSRKPFCFADPALRTISRLANESYHDFLIEEMLDIPELLKYMGNLSTYCDATERRRHAERVLFKAVTIEKNLDDWLSSFRLTHPYPYTWSLSTGHDGPGRSRHSAYFPQCLQFVDLMAAQAMVHYWAAMVIVLRCIMICQDILASNPLVSQRYDPSEYIDGMEDGVLGEVLTRSGLRDMALRFADCICCSAEYCASKDKGAPGPIILLFPLWVAKDLYADEGKLYQGKKSFCLEVFEGITKRGIHFSKALMDLSIMDLRYDQGQKV